MLSGRKVWKKNIVFYEISLFFLIYKNNYDKAYDIINLVEPNKRSLYLTLKILLSEKKNRNFIKRK